MFAFARVGGSTHALRSSTITVCAARTCPLHLQRLTAKTETSTMSCLYTARSALIVRDGFLDRAAHIQTDHATMATICMPSRPPTHSYQACIDALFLLQARPVPSPLAQDVAPHVAN